MALAAAASTDFVQDHYIREQAGLAPDKDYKKVEVPFGQQVEGIQAGRFVMGTYPQPFYTQLNAKSGYRTLFQITDVIDPAFSRSTLALAFRGIMGKHESRPPKKHGNIPL